MTPHFFSMDGPNYSRWLPVLHIWRWSLVWDSSSCPRGIHPREPFRQPVNTALCTSVDWHGPWAVHQPWQQDNWWYHKHQPETRSSGTWVSDVPRTSSNYNSYAMLLYSYARNKQYYYEAHDIVCFTELVHTERQHRDVCWEMMTMFGSCWLS